MNLQIKAFIFLFLLLIIVVSILASAINLNNKIKIVTDISCSDAKNLELYIKQNNHHASDKYILVKIKD